MRKIYLLCLSLTIGFLMNPSLMAQDAHFAQYYSFAQALNPALTGNFEGSYRVSAIYRNQWSSFLGKKAFVTPGLSIDLPLFEGQLKNDKLGLGIMVINDRFGESSLTTQTAALSLAYHKGFGKEGKHRISLGAQTAYVQRRIDSDSFVFYDQFDATSHTGQGTSLDVINLDRGSYAFVDVNLGVYWKSEFSKRFRMQAGFSTYHMTQPSQYFIAESDDYFLSRRYIGDMGFEVFVSDKWSIQPDFLYQKQGDFTEMLVGSFVGYYFNSGFRTRSSMHLGARYRLSTINGDAIVPMLQVEFRNMRIGGAYDVNLSNLRNSTNSKGAFEISLVYVGESIKSYKANKSLPARRF